MTPNIDCYRVRALAKVHFFGFGCKPNIFALEHQREDLQM